ncbi:MAG TPA: lysophospholipid acyltransferase family protein [Myxococcota bacterium]|nr:lysophospholipid acyltransferase family protein [Myxococcota bacterium]
MSTSAVALAVLSVCAWIEIAAVAVGGFFVQAALRLVTLPFDPGRRVAGRFLRLMAVAASGLHPLWRFAVHGRLPRGVAPRTVVVSNHESHADVFLISRLPWEMKWLAKAELFFIPFIGWCMWLAGDIRVKRGARTSAQEAMARCRLWLERGVPVAIFPEGTRSETGEMGPFKDGAFRLAIEARAALLPVAVAGTRRALQKHSWRFGRARAFVTVGEPIPTDGLTMSDVPALKARTRAAIDALRATLVPLVDLS